MNPLLSIAPAGFAALISAGSGLALAWRQRKWEKRQAAQRVIDDKSARVRVNLTIVIETMIVLLESATMILRDGPNGVGSYAELDAKAFARIDESEAGLLLDVPAEELLGCKLQARIAFREVYRFAEMSRGKCDAGLEAEAAELATRANQEYQRLFQSAQGVLHEARRMLQEAA